MTTIPWVELALFMISVALLALYGLTISGHFPAEVRASELRTRVGATIIWVTLIATCLAAVLVFRLALNLLPWFAITIGGGTMLLVAPMLLRPFPDRFVNGRAGLIIFAAGAATSALILWAAV